MSNGAFRWFGRLFGVACIAHIVGNAPVGQVGSQTTALGVATLTLGLVSVALVARPRQRLLVVAAALVLASVWLEAPFLGNHWLVMGFVSLAVLFSAARPDPWVWLAPTARWILLVFYAFAAFAKFNSGFFDPVASCGVFYSNQALGSVGLPEITPGSTVAYLVILGTALIEASVPVLLLIPRTRRYGVMLGVAFHTLISFDLDQHFFDFTAVLLLLFGLFLDDSTTEAFDRRANAEPFPFKLGVAAATLLVLSAVVPTTTVTTVLLRLGAFAVWIPFGAWFVWRVIGSSRPAMDVPLRLPGLVALGLVAIVFLNGLSPYLEVKTAYGFNMYANLKTVDGVSNHFIVRRTLPLTNEHDGLIEVIATNAPRLESYVESDYLLPERNLVDFLADHPEATVEIRRENGTIETLDAEDASSLPVLLDKFQLFRAVDTQDPPRCQAGWLPAR